MTVTQASVRNRFLASLAPETFEALQPLLDGQTVSAGATLADPDAPMTSVYFPETAVVSLVSPTAVEIEIGLIGREGALALPLWLGLERLPFRAKVQVSGRVLAASAGGVAALAQAHHDLRRRFGRLAYAFMVQTASTAYANARFTVEQRLARWLLMAHDRVDGDDLEFTHDFLATMLTVRRPGVTVATHILEGHHAIRALRGRITILSREKLAELAGDSYGAAEAEYERLIGVDAPP